MPTHTDTEVEPMAQSMAEVLIEQGARETTIENTLTVLTALFPERRYRGAQTDA